MQMKPKQFEVIGININRNLTRLVLYVELMFYSSLCVARFCLKIYQCNEYREIQKAGEPSTKYQFSNPLRWENWIIQIYEVIQFEEHEE